MPAPSPTSLIDVVDERNQLVGLARRRDVFRLHFNFRTVHVLVFNSQAELLLQKLTQSGVRHPGLWGSSVAGYLNAGEKYAEAAQRRLREELGISAPLTEIGVTRMDDEGVTKFIGVFTAIADHPRNAAPYQIAELKFFPLPVIERTVVTDPGNYTDTFRHVLEFWIEMS
jgi:8-oxo-dGTP pyrophosphatase MutT (NUDIX family)